jgi:hypothetical protein
MSAVRSLAPLVALALTACGPSDDRSAAQTGAERTVSLSTITPETRAEVARIGEEAAQTLRVSLAGRLMRAIESGGPEAAIDVCALEALPLTDSIARAAQGVSVKRTSTRVRNPQNAPDSLELLALHWFEDQDGSDLRPNSLVQMAGTDFRYYSPLRISALCLNCHGAADELSPAVREALRRRYPDDEAVGYRDGEFRGLVRVTVPATAVQ